MERRDGREGRKRPQESSLHSPNILFPRHSECVESQRQPFLLHLSTGRKFASNVLRRNERTNWITDSSFRLICKVIIKCQISFIDISQTACIPNRKNTKFHKMLRSMSTDPLHPLHAVEAVSESHSRPSWLGTPMMPNGRQTPSVEQRVDNKNKKLLE